MQHNVGSMHYIDTSVSLEHQPGILHAIIKCVHVYRHAALKCKLVGSADN